MGVPIPPEIQAYLKEPVWAHFATINKDSSPRVAMMWVESDGTHFIVNTPMGAVKLKNIKRDPRVFISVQPEAESPRRVVQVSGRVVEMTTEGANAHIDALAEKYTGVARYARRTRGMRRVKIVTEPLEITVVGAPLNFPGRG